LKCPSVFGKCSSDRFWSEEGIKLATEGLQEIPEERPTADGTPAAVPSRRRLLRAEGPRGSRSLILLLAALIAELAWLVTLGYVLFRFLA
jgi:hypothetical protein